MMQKMGSHEEEGAKRVLVALRKCLKCLSNMFKADHIKSIFYYHCWCFAFVKERKAHVIWNSASTDHLQRRLSAEAEKTQAMGTRSTEKAKVLMKFSTA